MDFLKLAENLGLDEDEFIELAELFIATGLSDLKGLKDAIEHKNEKGIIGKSHSIKGASGNLGFMDIYELAKKIEADARDGVLKGHEHALENIDHQIPRLDNDVNDRHEDG